MRTVVMTSWLAALTLGQFAFAGPCAELAFAGNYTFSVELTRESLSPELRAEIQARVESSLREGIRHNISARDDFSYLWVVDPVSYSGFFTDDAWRAIKTDGRRLLVYLSDQADSERRVTPSMTQYRGALAALRKMVEQRQISSFAENTPENYVRPATGTACH